MQSWFREYIISCLIVSEVVSLDEVVNYRSKGFIEDREVIV